MSEDAVTSRRGAPGRAVRLALDPEELNACVQCGLCLSACPTFRITGDETMSPRGRIALMREVELHGAPVTAEIVEAFDSCIQCRGCEPACPSGVPYGRLMEQTRAALADDGRAAPRWQRLALRPLRHPRLLRAGSSAIAIAQHARRGRHDEPWNLFGRLRLPGRLPIRRAPLRASGDDVVLFTGCVMDAWQRDVHAATQRVLEAAGFGVTPSGDVAPCCGALHVHAGLHRDAVALARRTMRALGGDAPIVVDSAGCGAAMKAYGDLIGDAGAAAFAARVVDAQEFLAAHVDALPHVEPLDVCVAIQDPCHLRHVQRVHLATRSVLAPFVRELVELDDDGLCCGAGGMYSVLQPALAGAARQRKLSAIERVRPDVVASANPGCSIHLAGGPTPIVHPVQLIDRAIHRER
jgi:glycolate oxidase iron-sulfur subunit